MNYEPNTTQWQVGDLVIHDADAKQPQMLMIVIGAPSGGLIRTRYFYPSLTHEFGKVWENEPQYLHDPARFNIALPKPDDFEDYTRVLARNLGFRHLTTLINNFDLLQMRIKATP